MSNSLLQNNFINDKRPTLNFQGEYLQHQQLDLLMENKSYKFKYYFPFQMTKIIPLLIIIASILTLQIVSLRVVYTCQLCKSLSCNSTSCYRLDGAGFSEFEICAENPCTPGDEYQEFGSECSINSNQQLCNSKCCISPSRNSYENRRCADGLSYASKYCDGELSIAAVGGIIFGSIVGLILIAVGACLIINRYQKKKQLQLKESSGILKASYRLRKKKSEIKKDEVKVSEVSQVAEIRIGGQQKKNHQSEVKFNSRIDESL